MDSAPPPPPPLSPSRKPTTIGKYIARFRYEKPQPRETRVAAQKSDFWWTSSPRYSRSPSPPSTWASGDVLSFPDSNKLDEEFAEEEELAKEKKKTSIRVKEEEKEEEEEEEEEGDLESKLRRYLGVWESESVQKLASRSEEVGAVESLQSWGSAELSLIELEGEEVEEEEDPEEVIQRVRRRLGWGADTLGGTSTSVLRPKRTDFQLAIDEDADRRQTCQTQLQMKPPLSPSAFRKEESVDKQGYRSSKWGSMERTRGCDDKTDEQVTMRSSRVNARDERAQMVMMGGQQDDKEDFADENEEEAAASRESASSQSMNDALSSKCSSAVRARSSGSSVIGSHDTQGSEPREDSCDLLSAPSKESFDADLEGHASRLDMPRTKAATEEAEGSQSKLSEIPATGLTLKLPLPLTVSPVRPEAAMGIISRSLDSNSPGYSHDSGPSNHGSEESVPGLATKALDSLVSLVVHSWENEFLFEPANDKEERVHSDSESDHDAETRLKPSDVDIAFSASIDLESPNVTLSTALECNSESKRSAHDAQGLAITVFSTDAPSSMMPRPDLVSASTEEMTLLEQGNNVEESKVHTEESDVSGEESDVSGEEDDHIVQMLRERIALLEEALHRIDS